LRTLCKVPTGSAASFSGGIADGVGVLVTVPDLVAVDVSDVRGVVVAGVVFVEDGPLVPEGVAPTVPGGNSDGEGMPVEIPVPVTVTVRVVVRAPTADCSSRAKAKK
jgi:hypothetical protein